MVAKAGLWAGSFVKPSEWRLGEAEVAQKTRPCAIKGNITSDGERIYHLPFQQLARANAGSAPSKRRVKLAGVDP
jgi:hypothetical protein